MGGCSVCQKGSLMAALMVHPWVRMSVDRLVLKKVELLGLSADLMAMQTVAATAPKWASSRAAISAVSWVAVKDDWMVDWKVFLKGQ